MCVQVSKNVTIINGVENHCSISYQHPVTWQPSKEGDHLIGRITLSKRSAMPQEAGSLLGLKVRLTGHHSQILYITSLTMSKYKAKHVTSSTYLSHDLYCSPYINSTAYIFYLISFTELKPCFRDVVL